MIDDVVLTAGDYEAVVTPFGAALRSARHRGRDLIAERPPGFDPSMRGAVLAPWPNRTADGRYEFDGRTHELEITEPTTRTAVHGLVTRTLFDVAARTARSAVLSTVIDRPSGYPWRVRLEVSIVVSEEGVEQRITATNESEERAPVGLGAHPSLVAGPAVPSAIDRWTLTVPADEVMLVSGDRMLPVGRVPVEGTPYDLRRRRPIADRVVNNALTALRPDDEGIVRVALVDPDDGTGVELRVDGSSPWLQVYTSDHGPAGEYRHAVAVEPSTCPPDALRSGVDLRVLEPGGSTSLWWELRAL